MLAVLPSHTPMTVPRGNHLKRSRGSFSPHHKPGQPHQERNTLVIAPTDPRSTRALTSNRQPQSRPIILCRRKRRRFSANHTGVLQNHLPVPSPTKSGLPTPSPAFLSTPPPISQPDEEDGLSVISDRLRLKMSNSSSIAAHGKRPTGQVCTYEDWQDIKELFVRAAEQYNGKHVPNIFNHPHFSFGPFPCAPFRN